MLSLWCCRISTSTRPGSQSARRSSAAVEKVAARSCSTFVHPICPPGAGFQVRVCDRRVSKRRRQILGTGSRPRRGPVPKVQEARRPSQHRACMFCGRSGGHEEDLRLVRARDAGGAIQPDRQVVARSRPRCGPFPKVQD